MELQLEIFPRDKKEREFLIGTKFLGALRRMEKTIMILLVNPNSTAIETSFVRMSMEIR